MTWYHITRDGGFVQSATGWQTFTRLRVLIVVGALVLLGTALVRQTRPVLIVRTTIGIVLGLLILRRIIFPPGLADPISSQIGVFVAFVGALAAVAGGLVDTGRHVVERYPAMAFWRPPAGELGAGADQTPARRGSRPNAPAGAGTVDSTAEEI